METSKMHVMEAPRYTIQVSCSSTRDLITHPVWETVDGDHARVLEMFWADRGKCESFFENYQSCSGNSHYIKVVEVVKLLIPSEDEFSTRGFGEPSIVIPDELAFWGPEFDKMTFCVPETISKPIQPVCTNCGVKEVVTSRGSKPKGLKRCSGCQLVHYCSVECQRRDWPEHKRFCQAAKKS